MSVYPGAIPPTGSAVPTDTLAAAGHTALHNTSYDEIRALATKLGTGSSTATASTVLRGTGAGTSAWGQVVLTTDVTGTLPVANGGLGQNSLTGLSLPSATLTSPSISNPAITGTVSGGATYENITTNAIVVTSGTTLPAGDIDTADIADSAILPKHLLTGAGSTWVWQTWAPTLTNLSGGTLTYAKYVKKGKTVHFRFKYTLGGAGVSGVVGLTLPVSVAADYAADDSETASITVLFRDTGTGVFPGFATFGPSNRIDLNALRTDATYAFIASTSSTVPHTWANTDVILVAGSYETS